MYDPAAVGILVFIILIRSQLYLKQKSIGPETQMKKVTSKKRWRLFQLLRGIISWGVLTFLNFCKIMVSVRFCGVCSW